MAVNRAVSSHPPLKNRHFERSAVRHGPEPCCRRRGACRVIATDPLRGRHGRLRYVNPQGDLRGLALGALAVRRGIRLGWQHQTVTEVAGEGCREAWPYTAHESHAGVGGMTECGLILLLPNHSRTLQLIPQKREFRATPPRPCVTCRNPGCIPGSRLAPRFGSTCRSALSSGNRQMGHSRRSSTSPHQPLRSRHVKFTF